LWVLPVATGGGSLPSPGTWGPLPAGGGGRGSLPPPLSPPSPPVRLCPRSCTGVSSARTASPSTTSGRSRGTGSPRTRVGAASPPSPGDRDVPSGVAGSP